VTTFLDLGVSRALVDTLERRDILAPFEIQSLVLRDALAGSDVLARSQTGSGKTLAFAIPIVQRLEPGDGRRPAALVLVPTRELAVQVADEFADIAAARGLRVGLAYGGVFAQYPVILREYFGATRVGAVYGGAMCVNALAMATGPFLAGLIHEVTGTYQVPFWANGTLGLAGTFLAISLAKPKPPAEGGRAAVGSAPSPAASPMP